MSDYLISLEYAYYRSFYGPKCFIYDYKRENDFNYLTSTHSFLIVTVTLNWGVRKLLSRSPIVLLFKDTITPKRKEAVFINVAKELKTIHSKINI